MKITHLDFPSLNTYYVIQGELCLFQFSPMALF